MKLVWSLLAVPEQTAAPMWAWHVHHDILLEPLTGSLAHRAAYIQASKAASEVDTRLRLLKPVAGTVPGALVRRSRPLLEAEKAVVDTRKAYSEALAIFNESNASCDQIRSAHYQGSKTVADYHEALRLRAEAWQTSEEARRAYSKASGEYAEAAATYARACNARSVLRLHEEECPNCTWDGKTIFPVAA